MDKQKVHLELLRELSIEGPYEDGGALECSPHGFQSRTRCVPAEVKMNCHCKCHAFMYSQPQVQVLLAQQNS